MLNIPKKKKSQSENRYKKRILNIQKLMLSPRKPKTPSYYQKMYSITSESLNESKSENNIIKTKVQKKSISLQNIFKKTKMNKTTFQFGKITTPKSPFSKRIEEPSEIRKHRIKISKPSKVFQDFITIQWLRKKFPKNIISKSIYSLLPDNGKPVIPENESEEEKKHRQLIEFLESLKISDDKDKFVNINPKYFFNKSTFENVLKLKKIFLEFDKDGNRRMELDEMLEMFESNNISANINDLVQLFFKGKKFKEKEVMKLYLNFHQFINFGLTKDQEFRQFMRNIKERAEKEKKSQNKNKIPNITEKDIDLNKEKDGYLPMSFNSLLNYFIEKGKERSSKEIINKAIEEMNKIIDKTKNKLKINNTLRRKHTSKRLGSSIMVKLKDINDTSKKDIKKKNNFITKNNSAYN